MTDTDRLDRMRGYFHTGDIPIATPHCLDAETIAALAEGTLDAESRARALAHVAACVHCQRAVASVAEVLADGPVTHEIDVVEGRARWPGRLLRVSVPFAAAASVVVLVGSVFLLRQTVGPASDELRGPLEVRLLAPAEDAVVVGRPRFMWAAVPGAVRYRVEVLNREGQLVFGGVAVDTTLMLPEGAALQSGVEYFWWVSAEQTGGAQARSPAWRLRIQTP